MASMSRTPSKVLVVKGLYMSRNDLCEKNDRARTQPGRGMALAATLVHQGGVFLTAWLFQ